MKNIFVWVSALLLLASCYDDEGNYDYHDINEVTISGIAGSYSVTTGVTTLTIEPEITGTMGTDNLEYEWRATIPYGESELIGTERNLNWFVNLDPRNYDLYLRVKDKTTGVTTVSKSTLIVGTAFSRGIMLMGENASKEVEVEMIAMNPDTMLVKNILTDKGLPVLHQPIEVLHTGSNNERLWVLTGEGGYYVDRNTFKGDPDNNFQKIAFVSRDWGDNFVPANIIPRIKEKGGGNGSPYNRVVVTTGGYLYLCSSFLNGGDFYQEPVNRLEAEPNKCLKASPYLMYMLNSFNGVVWYDTDNHRFMSAASTFVTYSTELSDFEDDIFPWNQNETGRDLVYAENTFDTEGGSGNGNSFALMKDKAGKFYVYKFYANGGNVVKRNYYEILPIATDFAKADFYAFSSRRTVIYYTVGSKLYAYDYNKGNERGYLLQDFGSKEITMMKMDTQIEPSSNPIYVATYDGTSGTLQKFKQGTNPDQVTIEADDKAVWTGLTKVKSMNWRANN